MNKELLEEKGIDIDRLKRKMAKKKGGTIITTVVSTTIEVKNDELVLENGVDLIAEHRIIAFEILEKQRDITNSIRPLRNLTLDEINQIEYEQLIDLIKTLKNMSNIKYKDGDQEKISMYEELRTNLETKYPELFKHKKKNK